MITTKHGSIFDSQAQVLVCPVNCVGVMGKGLALEFKKRFPLACRGYFTACEVHLLKPGHVLPQNNIVFAATKDHWIKPSEIAWVEKILARLAEAASDRVFDSIAIPQLGCGCGGLLWADVWPLYEKHLGALDCDVEVWIYE